MKPLNPRVSLAVASLAVLGLSACTAGNSTNVADDAGDMAANTLTPQERAQGWELLFNGQNFEGWRGYRAEAIPGRWTVQDGTLFFTGDDDLPGGDIMTAEAYGDFEFALEWKIAPCGNSGIMYRSAPGQQQPYNSGPEYQVLDNTCHPDALNGTDRQAGAAYDVYSPVRDVTRPAGEWNQTRIVADGNHIEHWLNGVKVVEYEIGSPDWRQRVAESKWANVSEYGTVTSGHIDLQDHSDPVWFRNIKIRRF
jgi:hypothetical protein